MPYYECVFITRQDVSAPQVEALADHFTKVIGEGGGSLAKREYWGLRSLSYRIRKNRKGHYMLLNIDAPASAVHEMERQMRLSEDIVRHLTVRVDELQDGPSAMMQSRASRDDRPRREDRFGDRPPRGDREDRFGDRPPRAERSDRRGAGEGDGLGAPSVTAEEE